MGIIFKRLFKPKVNATNHQPAHKPTEDKAPQNSKLQPPMPFLLAYEKLNVMNDEHRAKQIQYNPFFWMHTHGIAMKFLMPKPYPFHYVDFYDPTSESNAINTPTEQGTANFPSATRTTQRSVSAKSNSNASANPFDVSGASPSPFGAVPNPFQSPTKPQIDYQIRQDLEGLHIEWAKDNMFWTAARAFAKGFGVNTSVIIRTQEGGQSHFWVFGREHIKKLYTRNRIPVKVDIEWPQWKDAEELNTAAEGISSNIRTYTIGKNCVFFRPIPTVNNPFGEPGILPIWDAGVDKVVARYLQLMYMWNAGVIGKFVRYPDNIDNDIQANIEEQLKRGILSEGITISYPPAYNSESIDKMFQYEQVLGVDLNWEEYNSLLNQDSPFPKSFIEGQVETGALGGSAPEIDEQKEDEWTALMFSYLIQLIRDINSTFYDVKDTDYTVIPWDDFNSQQPSSEASVPGEATPDPTPSNEQSSTSQPKEQMATKSNSLIGYAKINSIAEGTFTYDAVLLPFGEHLYPTSTDPNHTEIVDETTVKQFLDDPIALREGYFHYNDHPNDPSTVTKQMADGKFVITGYDERGMVGKLITTQDYGEEFDLSSFYFSRDEEIGGQVFHRNIDFRNIVQTPSPRQKGAHATKRT